MSPYDTVACLVFIKTGKKLETGMYQRDWALCITEALFKGMNRFEREQYNAYVKNATVAGPVAYTAPIPAGGSAHAVTFLFPKR